MDQLYLNDRAQFESYSPSPPRLGDFMGAVKLYGLFWVCFSVIILALLGD